MTFLAADDYGRTKINKTFVHAGRDCNIVIGFKRLQIHKSYSVEN